MPSRRAAKNKNLKPKEPIPINEDDDWMDPKHRVDNLLANLESVRLLLNPLIVESLSAIQDPDVALRIPCSLKNDILFRMNKTLELTNLILAASGQKVDYFIRDKICISEIILFYANIASIAVQMLGKPRDLVSIEGITQTNSIIEQDLYALLGETHPDKLSSEQSKKKKKRGRVANISNILIPSQNPIEEVSLEISEVVKNLEESENNPENKSQLSRAMYLAALNTPDMIVESQTHESQHEENQSEENASEENSDEFDESILYSKSKVDIVGEMMELKESFDRVRLESASFRNQVEVLEKLIIDLFEENKRLELKAVSAMEDAKQKNETIELLNEQLSELKNNDRMKELQDSIKRMKVQNKEKELKVRRLEAQNRQKKNSLEAVRADLKQTKEYYNEYNACIEEKYQNLRQENNELKSKFDQISSCSKCKKTFLTDIQEEEEDDINCCICQDDLYSDETMECNHCKKGIHTGCINTWLTISPNCPLCFQFFKNPVAHPSASI